MIGQLRYYFGLMIRWCGSPTTYLASTLPVHDISATHRAFLPTILLNTHHLALAFACCYGIRWTVILRLRRILALPVLVWIRFITVLDGWTVVYSTSPSMFTSSLRVVRHYSTTYAEPRRAAQQRNTAAQRRRTRYLPMPCRTPHLPTAAGATSSTAYAFAYNACRCLPLPRLRAYTHTYRTTSFCFTYTTSILCWWCYPDVVHGMVGGRAPEACAGEGGRHSGDTRRTYTRRACAYTRRERKNACRRAGRHTTTATAYAGYGSNQRLPASAAQHLPSTYSYVLPSVRRQREPDVLLIQLCYCPFKLPGLFSRGSLPRPPPAHTLLPPRTHPATRPPTPTWRYRYADGPRCTVRLHARRRTLDVARSLPSAA